MEGDLNPPASTTQCRGGCGFYGSSANEGLCSMCFKEQIKRQQDPDRLSPTSNTLVSSPVAIPSPPVILASTSSQTPAQKHNDKVGSVEEASALVSDESEGNKQIPEESAKPKPKNRCHTCNKKVGLTGFECRCGGSYCSTHRYSDMHVCSFDYKKLGEDEIRKNNPVVVGNKIEKL